MPRHVLFLVASTRASGEVGNTEWLAHEAARALAADDWQTWLHLARMDLPAFVDQRHTVGRYPMPEGDLRLLLDATLAASDLVFVMPIYWFSIPAPLKLYLDHWSAFLRVDGLGFKEAMATKTLRAIITSGDRAKAQPAIDSLRLCAQFLGMRWGTGAPAPDDEQAVLWGKGGAPGAVRADGAAIGRARSFLQNV